MPGKFTPTQRQEVIAKVAKLDRRGWGQHKIAKEVGVSQPMVGVYLKIVRKQYVEAYSEDRKELIAEKIQQLRDVREEAWEAYERSKKDHKKFVKEVFPPAEIKIENGKGKGKAKGKGKKGGPGRNGVNGLDTTSITASVEKLKKIFTREGRLPANAYLDTILKTIEIECRLLGINAPEEWNIKGVVVGAGIGGLIDAPVDVPPDRVAEELKKLEHVKEVPASEDMIEGKVKPNGQSNGEQS